MKPTQPHHFIGKTHTIAKAVFNKIPALQSKSITDPLDRCFLFTGPAGTGKSSLAEAFAIALAEHRLAIEQVNGQSMSVDVVRRWQEEGWYFPLYGKLWVKIIDEIDAAATRRSRWVRMCG